MNITDYNNIGYMQTLVFGHSGPEHREMPYPSGVAMLIRQRLRRRVSLIDEDFIILDHIVDKLVLPRFIPPFSKLTVDQHKEWISNTASIVTSLICGVGTVLGLGFKVEGGLKFTILQILVTALTGYWVSDTLFRINNMHVLKNKRFQYFLLFHHLLGIIAVQIAVLHREMMDIKLIFILMELGSLFINIRFCLLDLNFDRDSLVYEGVSYCMIATFFLTRLLPVPYMYHEAGYKCIWRGDNCSAAVRPFIAFNSILYTIFTALNLYWFYVMIIGLAKHSLRKRINFYHTSRNTKNASSASANCSNTTLSSTDDSIPPNLNNGGVECSGLKLSQLEANSTNDVIHNKQTSDDTNDSTCTIESNGHANKDSSKLIGGVNRPITLHYKIANQISVVSCGASLLDQNEDDVAKDAIVDQNGNSNFLIGDGLKQRKPTVWE